MSVVRSEKMSEGVGMGMKEGEGWGGLRVVSKL